MKKAYFSRAAFTFCVMTLLLLAAAPWSGQNASPQVSVTIVSDDAPGLAARHGLNKLAAALKARGADVAQTNSLEAARGETLIVAGRAAASAAAAALHKSLGVAPPEGAESLLIRRGRWNGKTAWLVSGADDRGLMYALLDIADRVSWAADPSNPLGEVRDVTEKPYVAERGVLMDNRGNGKIYPDLEKETPYVVVRLQRENIQNRAEFLKLIDRPRAPLAPEAQELGSTDGLAQTHFTFAADAEQRVPGILVKQTKSSGRRPVVVALHGTGGNKEGQLALLKELAGLGFIGVAIDGRYHGERTKAGKGSAEYSESILRAYRSGHEHPFLYDTVWDVLRLIDYLETREDVDAKRIGLIGFSKGGMETYLAAAVDPRVAVAVPCIGVQSFRWALENNSWQSRVETFQAAVNGASKDAGIAEINADFVRKFYDRVVPGVHKEFDGPEMLPLIAPRPLLVINGDSDPRTPMPGVMDCATRARQAYANARAEDKFQLLIQEKTGHAVTPAARQAAIAWFVKWLKP